jgi:CubicO group peptidase (beta-lactamase class C family)
METLKNFYILILLFILAVGGKYTLGNEPEDRATRMVKRFMKIHKMPGLSVTVGKNDEIIWSRSFGFADVEQNIFVTPKTRFRIGSVSKTVTSAAIGRLLDQGKLDLNAPVQRCPLISCETMANYNATNHGAFSRHPPLPLAGNAER